MKRTSASHCTPLSRTASITESTFFSRARWFAFRVLDNFQGVFLHADGQSWQGGDEDIITDQSRPPRFIREAWKGPNISNSSVEPDGKVKRTARQRAKR